MEYINLDEDKTCELENDIFGADHRAVGRKIMESWNFPAVYADSAGEHGNVNIQSPHKELIVLVSIADNLSSVLHEFGFSDETKKSLDPYLKYSGLKLDQLSYFQDQFMIDMKNNPLFQECKSLFRL